MTDCSNEGAISVKKAQGISGKEPEIGGIVGYANATFTGCVNKGDVTLEPGGTCFLGGLVGGFGKADKQWTGCTIDCKLTTSASVGSILGRFRNAGTNTVYYKDFTLGAGVSSYGPCGNLNGNSMVEGTMPE